jgi:hypothetical protein
VARRIEQVEHQPSCSNVITEADTEMPRSRSIFIQSDACAGSRPRRTCAGRADRAARQQQVFGQRRLAGVRVRDDREGAPARACASSGPNPSGVQTVQFDPGTKGPVQGVGIEGQDIVAMADQMVRDMLANPMIAGRQPAPRVILDAEYFRNESAPTHQHQHHRRQPAREPAARRQRPHPLRLARVDGHGRRRA